MYVLFFAFDRNNCDSSRIHVLSIQLSFIIILRVSLRSTCVNAILSLELRYGILVSIPRFNKSSSSLFPSSIVSLKL